MLSLNCLMTCISSSSEMTALMSTSRRIQNIRVGQAPDKSRPAGKPNFTCALSLLISKVVSGTF